MASINSKALVILLIIGMAAIPALGNSGGPPYLYQDGDLTVKYGCSCHNNGATSERAVVMITSVPIMYNLDESYQLTIKVADSLTLSGGDGNTKAGFLLSSENLGTFTWTEDEDIRIPQIVMVIYPTVKQIQMEFGLLHGQRPQKMWGQ